MQPNQSCHHRHDNFITEETAKLRDNITKFVEQQKELELKLKATEAAEEKACELEGQLTAKKARAQQAPGRKRNIEL